MVASGVYFSVEVAQFLLDLTKTRDWWLHSSVAQCCVAALASGATVAASRGNTSSSPGPGRPQTETETDHSQDGTQGEQTREGPLKRGHRLPGEEHSPLQERD